MARPSPRILTPILACAVAASVSAQRGAPPPPPPGAPPASRDVQKPATGTGTIAGIVTTDGAGARPVRRSLVTLTGAELRGSRMAITDDEGRFVFTDLPDGRFTVSSSKPGFLTTYYGASRSWRSPGMPIALSDGQRVLNLALKMQWGAVVTGTITDQNGQPVSTLRVQALESRIVNGEQTFAYAGGSGTVTTDDRGVYRIFGLPPGTFIVAAASLSTTGARLTTPEEIQWALQQGQPGPRVGALGVPTAAPAGPEPGQMVGYAPEYYPGTTEAGNAATVTVRAGEERTGLDFAIQFVPTAKVEGIITRADGQSVQGTQLYLFANSRISSPMLESPFGNRVVVQSADGQFSFRSVRPGRYTLTARASSRSPAAASAGRPGPPIMDLWALADVTVSGRDVSGLRVSLEPGMTVGGKVVFDGQTLQPPTDLARVSINLRAPPSAVGVTLGVPSSQASAEGTFAFQGVTPGRYLISGSAPSPPGTVPGTGWTLKTVTLKGQDVLDAPFEVTPNGDIADLVLTFTDQTTEISGMLLDTAGRPAPEYYVFVFPTNKVAWFQGSRRLRPPTRPASDGKFRVAGLPPGEYYVAALTEFEPTDIYDASFLEQLLSASFKITLAEGERKTQDLKLAGGRH